MALLRMFGLRRYGLCAAAMLAVGAAWAAMAVPAQPSGCTTRSFEGTGYTVCTFRADRDDIRLWHSDPEGRLLGSFRAVDAALRAEGARLVFAMNGGMYHEDRSPVGHYVESHEEMVGLVRSAGPGNFGLRPNGVFCLGEGWARVVETERFAAQALPCRYATQSGPMLVIDGALHPRFLPQSDSLFIRNGVGVAPDGVTVHFAISEGRVNFDTFGRLFRDDLGVDQALYLDGKVSRLFAPQIGRADLGWPMGPIVGVAAPQHNTDD